MQRLYDSSIFYEVPGVFIETERRIMVVRGYGENGELSFNGYSISVLQDEKFWRLVAHHLNVLNTTELNT